MIGQGALLSRAIAPTFTDLRPEINHHRYCIIIDGDMANHKASVVPDINYSLVSV